MEFSEVYQNYPVGLLLQAESDIKKIEKMLNKGRCIVATENGAVAGCYVLREPKRGAAAEVTIVVVDEAFRGKGIARALFADAENRAKQDGFSVLQKQTPSAECPVAKLCASVGYAEDGETPNLWKKTL